MLRFSILGSGRRRRDSASKIETAALSSLTGQAVSFQVAPDTRVGGTQHVRIGFCSACALGRVEFPRAACLRRKAGAPFQGTLRRSSSSHTLADTSLGARQSLRGDSDPPEPTFGPFGSAERLN